jgi:DNA-binding CsgD family transcriptional regulator
LTQEASRRRTTDHPFGTYAAAAADDRRPKGVGMNRTARRRYRLRRGPGGLTRREVEVLRLVASGESNRAVARLLWVTDETVKFHLSNVYRRLSVRNRAEASEWARAQGLLDPGVEPRFEVLPAV